MSDADTVASRTALRTVARFTRWWGPRWNRRPLRKIYHPTNEKAGLVDIVDAKDGLRFAVNTASALEWTLYFYSIERYEPEIRTLLEDLVRPGMNVIDIGANIGLHTLPLARHIKPGFVLAFEPHPIAFQRLNANIALNRLLDLDIRTRQEAVAQHPGEASLHIPEDVFGYQAWASLQRNHDDEFLERTRQLTVRCVTLDGLSAPEAKQTIGLIKIDVEGLEPAVLLGGQDLLARDRPVIVMEYTASWWSQGGQTLATVIDLMNHMGYTSFKSVAADGTLVEIDSKMKVGMLVVM
jgi:FkbM family methyltransferase